MWVLCSSEILQNVEWLFLTAILGEPIGSIFKCQEIQKVEQSTTWANLTQSSFWDLSINQFFTEALFWKPALFLFSGKEAPNPVNPLGWAIQINEHLTNCNLLRYAPENGSSPWVVTGKSLLKNKKLTTWLKNKNWTNPQIKNHKKSHELRLIRPQTQQRNPEHTYLNS